MNWKVKLVFWFLGGILIGWAVVTMIQYFGAMLTNRM